MRGGIAHACETLEQGGFLACRQRHEVKCSLLVHYPTKNQDPLFLLDCSKDPTQPIGRVGTILQSGR